MTTTGENLRTFLLADSAITDLVGAQGVYQNIAPATAAVPYVWFIRRGDEKAGALEGESGYAPLYEYFDLECWDDSVSGALALAAAVRARLDEHSGTFGDASIAWAEIGEQSDEYQFRNPAADEALSGAALDLEITNP
jgi:hypothetical protein